MRTLSRLSTLVRCAPAISLVASLFSALPASAQGTPAAPAAEQAAGCPAILQHTFPRLQDEKPQALCQYSGKVVLGFPSNDFSQESGSNKEIADFCESTFGVKFPMFAKSSVRGPEANALFKQLAELSGSTPKWNFYKYLIGRDGKVVESYSSMTAPDDRAFVRDLEKQLGSN